MSVYIGGTKVAGLEKELPAQAGNAGKYLYTDGQNASWEEASTAQIWIGTQAEYEALGTYDPEVVYQVTDDFQNLIPNVGQITEDVNDLKAHAVVEFQAPTATNNYTWYRKYADGWVEQGGNVSTSSDSAYNVVLPVTMANNKYTALVTRDNGSQDHGSGTINARWCEVWSRTTTSFYTWGKYGDATDFSWQVSGMAA